MQFWLPSQGRFMILQILRDLERLLCSETFWAYFPGIEKAPSFAAIQRPYPERVAGQLLSYRYDPAADQFTCA